MTKLYEIRKDIETWRKSTPDQLRDAIAELRKEQFKDFTKEDLLKIY